MDAQRKKHIAQTSEACNNMILGIRQLRLSVLELFNTLADSGVDPEKNHHTRQAASPSQHGHHHHDSHLNSKLFHQQTIAGLTNSHTLCTASNPPARIQKQLEHQQQSDLIQFVNQSVSSMTTTIRSLEHNISVLMQNTSFINTGETVHIGMDSSLDKHNLYMELCSSYKTISRLHDYSAHCHALLHQQSLKRVHKRVDTANTNYNHGQPALSQYSQSSGQPQQQSSQSGTKTESIVATFNPYIYKICASKQSITNLLDVYLNLCEHMQGTYSQPFGVSTGVLQISVKRVLKAILVMRGIMIDAVIVKAYHESFSSEATKDGSSASLLASAAAAHGSGGSQFEPDADDIDLWSESKYNVFRRLTHHANAAVLHFQYPTYPEIAVRSFLVSNTSVNS